jgi:hypothetical protein
MSATEQMANLFFTTVRAKHGDETAHTQCLLPKFCIYFVLQIELYVTDITFFNSAFNYVTLNFRIQNVANMSLNIFVYFGWYTVICSIFVCIEVLIIHCIY